MGIGTQIDGLGHFGLGHRFYNGISADELAASNKLEPAALPPIVTRGVLLDMTRALGKPRLEAGDRIGRAEIDKALKRQHLAIRKGDVVLFHTGWMALATSDPERFRAGEPGLVADGAEYLAELGVVAVGADNIALEASPSDHPGMALVHSTLLTRNGVYILEMIDTRALAADGVGEFLFVLGVPRLRGTVQMTINPVAIR
jgi:kynurenine formamidase